MAKRVGLAIDFTASGYKALEWAKKHISWDSKDIIYIIHVRHWNAHRHLHEAKFKRIEKIPTDGLQEKWEDIKREAFQFTYCKDNIVVHVYGSNINIPKMLCEAGEELKLDLLVVGSVANGGSNSNAEVGRYLARCEANWSLVIAK